MKMLHGTLSLEMVLMKKSLRKWNL